MADIALDVHASDIALSSARFSLVYDADYRAQRLQIALRHVMGEFFRDQSAGTDYLGAILGKSTDLSRRAEYRRRVLQVPGIAEVTRIELTLDASTRKLSGEIECVQSDGEPLEVQFGGRA
jgi:hypothetical protein